MHGCAGPNGLGPTLLVYGASPRLGVPNGKPTQAMYERSSALEKLAEAMSK